MFVDELWHDSVRRAPQAIALVAGSRSWTYAELGRRVDRVAGALVERGLAPGDRVAVDLANLPEAVVGIWGALAAGAAFVCLDATSPDSRFLELLADFRPRALLTRSERLAGLEGAELPEIVLCVDTGAGDSGARSLTRILEQGEVTAVRPRRPADPADALANLVYTSGSTGLAKGVMMTHRSMGAAIRAITSYLRADPSDVNLCVLPLSFDYGLYQVLMAGAVGSCLVLEPGFGYPGELLQLLRQRRITTLPGVPTLFALLLRLGSFSSQTLPELRTFTNTGAALPVPHVRELRRRFPGARIYLMYGLTECKRVSYLPPEEVDVRPNSVGIAMPGCEVAVVDGDGHRLPPGQVGELVVRGPNLMAGYWERPAATDLVLKEGPWPGKRCLFTGDLFRTDEEGRLYFVARQDDVLKSRGQKVAPSEIEETLQAFPGVAEATVVGVEHPVRGVSIRAVLVPEHGATLAPARLREHAAQRLESFKVPHEFVILDEMPRGERGKVDREALRSVPSLAGA